MRKLLYKSTLFLAGILIFVAILACLPLDAFTFRNWESVLWGTDLRPTFGKFYPNKTIRRTESGDLGHGTQYQELKPEILWKTDPFGFRNDPAHIKDCPIILVGDSNVVGTGTSQEFILSEQLGRKLNVPVFNYSTMVIDPDFLGNLKAMRLRPKMVICETLGYGRAAFETSPKEKWRKRAREGLRAFFAMDLFMEGEIALDRFWKKEPIRYFQSRINSAFGVFPMPVVMGNDNMLFMTESLLSERMEDSVIKRNADVIAEESAAFRKIGMAFIYVLLPEKESVYREFIPSQYRSGFKNHDYTERLKRELDLRGVRAVDLYPRFRERALAGERLYFSDDKHWNKKGIELASDLIAQEVARASSAIT